MSETRAGTITAKQDRYMEWKTIDGSYESTLFADYRTFFLGMFQQQRLLDILQNFICFDKNQGKYAKILTAYHQYYAVGKALQRTRTAVEGNGKSACSGTRRVRARASPWCSTPTSWCSGCPK